MLSKLEVVKEQNECVECCSDLIYIFLEQNQQQVSSLPRLKTFLRAALSVFMEHWASLDKTTSPRMLYLLRLLHQKSIDSLMKTKNKSKLSLVINRVFFQEVLRQQDISTSNY